MNIYYFKHIFFIVTLLIIAGCKSSADSADSGKNPENSKTVTGVKKGAKHDGAKLEDKSGNLLMPKSDNILFIVIDALRSDRLGTYGFKQDTSPTIDSLAKEGVVFESLHSAKRFV